MQEWNRKVIQQTWRQHNKSGGKQKQRFRKQEEHDPEEYITLGDNNIVLESVRQATEIYEPDDTRTNLQYNL